MEVGALPRALPVARDSWLHVQLVSAVPASHLTFLGLGGPISKTSREVPRPFDILSTLRFRGSELTLPGESPEKQKLGRREERTEKQGEVGQ